MGAGGTARVQHVPRKRDPAVTFGIYNGAQHSLLLERAQKLCHFFTPSSKLQNLHSILYLLCKKESYSPRTTEHVYICPVYQGPAWMVQAGQSLTPKKARPVTSLQPGGRGVGSTETLRLSQNAFTQKKPPGQSRSAAEVMNGVQCAERGVYEWARPAVRRGGSMPSGQRLA